MKFGIAVFAAAAFLSNAAVAGSYSCGCTPPPPTTSTKKPNSGVGNGGEPVAGVPSYKEVGDRDPGRSGAHNQAFKNSDKPRSAAAQMP